MEEKYTEWFETYTNGHLTMAGAMTDIIERKKRHTMRVLGHVREIIKESGVTPELAGAMEITALLHDVGRFPQCVKGMTAKDYDHGEAGARIIADTDLLDSLSMDMRGTILSGIKYHNRATLPAELSQDTRLVLEALRDADKLDAIRNALKYLNPDVSHGKAGKLAWDDEEISPAIVDLTLKRLIIPLSMVKWSNDYYVFLCCWIYDLHFVYAFKHLRVSGNFEALLAKLPDNDQCATVKTLFREDLDWIIAKSQP